MKDQTKTAKSAFLSFQLDLFKENCAIEPLISPYSIQICLAQIVNMIVSYIDRNNVIKVLRCKSGNFFNYNKILLENMKTIERCKSINTANIIFTTNDGSSYHRLKKSNKSMALQVESLNSLMKSIPSMINRIVKNKTNGRIKELMNPMMKLSSNKVAISSVINFEARFKFPFDNHSIHKFYGFNETREMLMLVSEKREVAYSKGFGMVMIDLPFEDDKTSLIIIKPHKRGESQFKKMIQNLNKTSFQRLMNKRKVSKFDILLPELNIETDSCNCFDELSAIGLKKKEFVLETQDKLNHFRQKCTFCLNKYGSIPEDNDFIPEKKRKAKFPKLTFNRPFIYFVYNKKPQTILLSGSALFPF